MNHQPTLIIMAAGMGSRFGGNKQIAPVDDAGHIIIDFSIYDAIRAGFGRVICVIKPEMEAGFRAAIGDRIAEKVELRYAFQSVGRLPEGYATVLSNNGANLSQGQRQLIAIARAAVADPPVLIMDEATSSIDTRTEAIVSRGMDSLMEGRTVFVIAHRLSTVMNSDVIMVLDHGRIIERGSHDKLIAERGTYYQLYTGAFELE